MKVACNQKLGVLIKTEGEQDEWNNSNNSRNKNEIKCNSTNYVVLRAYEVDFSIRQALINCKCRCGGRFFSIS